MTDKYHIHFLVKCDATDRVCDIVKAVKQENVHYLWQKSNIFFQTVLEKEKLLVRRLFCLQYRRDFISYFTK